MSEQQKEQQLLETVDRIIAEGPYKPAWSSLMQAKTPDWFKQKRLASSSTGASTVFPPTPTNGTQETCTSRECPHTNTI